LHDSHGDVGVQACLSLPGFKLENSSMYPTQAAEKKTGKKTIDINREVPHALKINFLEQGQWGRPQLTAIDNYMRSLSNALGAEEVQQLMDAYKACRKTEDRKKFAEKLSLAKNSSELETLQREAFTQEWTDSEGFGWQTCFQI